MVPTDRRNRFLFFCFPNGGGTSFFAHIPPLNKNEQNGKKYTNGYEDTKRAITCFVLTTTPWFLITAFLRAGREERKERGRDGTTGSGLLGTLQIGPVYTVGWTTRKPRLSTLIISPNLNRMFVKRGGDGDTATGKATKEAGSRPMKENGEQ